MNKRKATRTAHSIVAVLIGEFLDGSGGAQLARFGLATTDEDRILDAIRRIQDTHERTAQYMRPDESAS
jgi:hypothetical protein